MTKRILILLPLLAILLAPGSALAQDYLFRLDELTADAYWNSDGTLSIDYEFVFTNDPRGHPIEYVDVALPTAQFDVGSIQAWANGNPLDDISRGGYEGEGVGVAVGLGPHTIPPGQSGVVRVFIGRVENVLFLDPAEDDYVSAVFAPARFTRQVTTGNTDLMVIFHLPPGVQPDEPRWHQAPSGFPAEPDTGLDAEGRVAYRWHNPTARPYEEYRFGASFPEAYIPAEAVQRRDPPAAPGAFTFDPGCLIPLLCFGFFGFIIFFSVYADRKRRLQYLPPKIAIEGHGIKRGLTAVEAAILLEQPMDKIMTMILFATIKKNAAEIVTRDPLELSIPTPLPEDLRPYEKDFLEAFREPQGRKRQKALEEAMVSLIKSISQKMKGFSRRETVDYYRDIMRRAWSEVEAAETPEVKSQKFDEVMEWTMLDRDFDRRTRDVFRTGPVFVPMWWPRYDPGYGRTAAGPQVRPAGVPAAPSGPRGGPTGAGPSLPSLPGGEFAASMVGGIQGFSSKVIGNMADFTGRVTQQTNPAPKATTRSGGGSRGGFGGGGGCACACACAGCACACAGGGR